MSITRIERVVKSGQQVLYDADAAKYKPAATSSCDETKLPNRIREVVLAGELPLFDKRREIARLVQSELSADGKFVRTADGRGFFFKHSERRLYDVEQADFRRLLSETSGLSATESFFKFALDILQTETLRHRDRVEVQTFSYYDEESGALAVSDGGPGVWRRERDGPWTLRHNGEDGIFFLTDSEAMPWTPEFTGDEAQRTWWISQFRFAETDSLSIENSRTLTLLWVVQQFFPPLRRTRVIPAFLGPQGSGKTTGERLIGRLFVGPNFDVTGVQRDREDAFVAAVTNRVFLGLDNVDSKIPWLADALALYATGQRYRLRKLYTTNEEASYSPRAILLLSSRDPRFNRPDVTERLLPLNFERPESYQTENEIFSELEQRRGQIMGSFLRKVAEIADGLATQPPKPIAFRMADFASFGHRVFSASDKGNEFLALLRQLEKRQAEFASEGDGLVAALAVFLEKTDGASVEMPVGQLFRELSALAEAEGLAFPKNTQSFGQRLSTMRRVIELELGLKFDDSRGHQSRRVIRLTPKVAKRAQPEQTRSECGE